MLYSIRPEPSNRFGRQLLTLWSGAFCSDYEGEAVELPKHNGFMVSVNNTSIRVECESPRTIKNFQSVDEAINKALNDLAGKE